MNIQAFSHLTGPDQLRTIGERGVLLLERFTKEGRCLYYRVRNFYVELLFLSGTDDHVQVMAYTIGHPRFLRMLCLLPSASLSSMVAKAMDGPLSHQWN
ncbi:MAG: hypothetical protein H6592_15045 [Flavobacteriales bacterium]|nr:hypothetical protein [Flavobacteriales bacterium]HPF91326.1 hypothetical protein [Flavobacteriales bacterium]